MPTFQVSGGGVNPTLTLQRKIMNKEPDKTGENWRDGKGKFIEGHPGIGGRPKGAFSLVEILKEELQKMPEGGNRETFARLLIKRYLKKAISDGDARLIIDAIDRIDGKAKENVNLSGQLALELIKELSDVDTKQNYGEDAVSSSSKTDGGSEYQG